MNLNLDPFWRSSIGFDRVLDMMDESLRHQADNNYPPYNIARTGENSYRITLAVEPGMTLCIMGVSGTGKSTLLALAPRIYELAGGQGTISFGGLDIREIDVADLRRRARTHVGRRVARGAGPRPTGAPRARPRVLAFRRRGRLYPAKRVAGRVKA